MVRCFRCGLVFDVVMKNECPHCHDEDIEDVEQCEGCGKYLNEYQLINGYCACCGAGIERQFKTLLYSQFTAPEIKYISEMDF